MKKRIIIADADKDFRDNLIKALDSDEFTVVGVASDGEEALQMITNKPTGILIIDLMLPKCDGLTLLEHLRDNCPRYRPQVLVTTAFISSYVAFSAARLGVNQLIHKPCSIDVIIKNLQRMTSCEKSSSGIFLWNGVQNVASLVTSILHEIGVPANIKGYQYLREAIILAVKDEDSKNAILKSRYLEIANMYETTVTKVERAIRVAIEIAWDRGDLDTLQRYFGYTVSNTKGKPTNTEFISIIADCIRLWMEENTGQLK